jgi:tetratricopeptide (TPR) repeat protein
MFNTPQDTTNDTVPNKGAQYTVHAYELFVAYWRRDYIAAEKALNDALQLQDESPENIIIYVTFFGALVNLHLYRQFGGHQRLKNGTEMTGTVGKWAKDCMEVFGNKWMLLKAECCSSLKEHDEAHRLYNASIKIAQEQDHIHELGLAYELFGEYHSNQASERESLRCFQKAYIYYSQWGATAVAARILLENSLDIESINSEVGSRTTKRSH